MKLYVVRHGETNYNVAGLHNADPSVNVYLTEKGIAEAKEVGQKLQSIVFDAIYVSELPRTHQTAELIKPGEPFVIDKRLNDVNSGFEGKTVAEYHQERNAAADSFTYRHDDSSESSEDVYRRIVDFLQDLKRKDYQTVLIVTSMHCFRHFRNILDNLNPRENMKHAVANAEILEREL